MNDDFLAYINELIIQVESDMYRTQMKISELVFELLTRSNNSQNIECCLVTETLSGSQTFNCTKIYWNEEESLPYCTVENHVKDVSWDTLSTAQQFEVLQAMYHRTFSDRLMQSDNDSQEIH